MELPGYIGLDFEWILESEGAECPSELSRWVNDYMNIGYSFEEAIREIIKVDQRRIKNGSFVEKNILGGLYKIHLMPTPKSLSFNDDRHKIYRPPRKK